jgi:hypothetical protein
MKKIIILSSIVLLVANLLFGLILSFYGGCNVAMSSFVIVGTGLLLYLIHSINLKDGYKVSLTFLFTIVGCLEFVLSLIAPNRFTDNWWLIIVIMIMAFEAIMLIVTNTVSNKIK